MRALKFMLLLLVLCIPKPVRAESGSITIRLKDLGTPVEQVEMALYRVGDMDGGTPVIDGFFHIRTFPEEAYRIEQAANTISGKLTRPPEQRLTADRDGILTFGHLETGVYLLRLLEGSDTYGDISPFLVFLPYYENGILRNELEIEPKASPPEEKIPPKRPPDSQTLSPRTVASSSKSGAPAPVKTGDASGSDSYMTLLLLSAALAAALILNLRKGGEE